MSAKNCDTHNRFRDKTIAFRVSSEEDKQINTPDEKCSCFSNIIRHLSPRFNTQKNLFAISLQIFCDLFQKCSGLLDIAGLIN